MRRYIDANKLQVEMMDMIRSGMYGLEDMVDAVIEAPTIDAVPVEWIENYVKWLRKREIYFAPEAIETMLSYYKDSQAYCNSCGERRKE